MRKLLLLILLPLSVFCQNIPVANLAMGTIADLRLQPAQVNEKIEVLGLTAATDGQGGTYQWNPNSTAADDGVLTIQVTGVTIGRWVRVVNTTYQPETLNYLARINAAGGKVNTATLSFIDKFISRGKSFGWFPLAKEIWIPVGDFAASKVKVVSATNWTFNNLVATDYSEVAGDVLTTNSNKYINTGFVPNSNGLTSQNISMAFANTVEAAPASFGRIVGTASIADSPPYISATENKVSAGVAGSTQQDSFLLEATAIVLSNNNLLSSMYMNGSTHSNQTNTSLVSLADTVNIFRSLRSNGMQYATGSLGFYWMGTYLTPAQATDLNQAIMILMRDLRSIWKKPCAIFFGDSISAATGSTNGLQGYAHLLALKLGLRLQSNAQGGSRMNDTYTNTDGYVSAFNRYTSLQFQPASMVFMLFGTNDIGQDPNSAGTPASATTFGNTATTIVTALQSYNHRVVIGLIPYKGSNATAAKIAMYNAQLITLAKNKNLMVVDFYDELMDTGSPDSYLADGVHPNNAGHALYANLAYADIQGRPYRDALIPATLVPANSSATVTVSMYGAKNNTLFAVGVPTVATAGITYSVAWTSNDTYTVTITNSTGSPITTAATNIRIQIFIDFLS